MMTHSQYEQDTIRPMIYYLSKSWFSVWRMKSQSRPARSSVGSRSRSGSGLKRGRKDPDISKESIGP